MNANQ
jgi:phosphoadenosine phosphosulfate reductase